MYDSPWRVAASYSTLLKMGVVELRKTYLVYRRAKTGFRTKVRRIPLLCIIISLGFAISMIKLGKVTFIHDQRSEPKIVLILAPKPSFSTVPQNLLLWRNIIKPLGGNVLLLLNNPTDRSIATDAGFLVDYVKESESGLPLLSSVMQMTTKFTSAILGFCNSDLEPAGSSTKIFLQYILSERWRNDWLENETDELRQKVPAHKSAWLLVANRMDYGDSITDRTVHKTGGIDMWMWNEGPLGILGFNQIIPAFRVGRPLFDNWLTAMAIGIGKRHVIDVTLGVEILHKNHLRFGHLMDWSNASALLADDQDWLENKRLATTPVCSQNKCLMYEIGLGTACQAPLQLEITNDTDGHPKYHFTKRTVRVACPRCSHCYA